MNNSEQPINPVKEVYEPCNTSRSGYAHNDYNGLTKREHFASLAMQGLLTIYDSSETSPIYPNEGNVKYMAKLAIVAADALLEELEKPTIQK